MSGTICSEKAVRFATQVIRMAAVKQQASGHVLVGLLHFVGYCGVTIVRPGLYEVPEYDADGERTGNMIPGNCHSNLVALVNAETERGATAWLDSLWEKAASHDESEVHLVAGMIDTSVQLQPIAVTEHGETIREYPASSPHSIYASHQTDETEFSICIHDVCNCWVDRMQVSTTHDALVCRGCGLRVVFPNTIRTYGDLRSHLADL